MSASVALRTAAAISLTIVVGPSCITQRPQELQEEPRDSTPALVVPDVLDDDWTSWILGEWEGFGEPGSQEKRNGSMKAELGFNGQFLIITYEFEISAEDIEALRESMKTEDDQAAKFRRHTHKEVEYYTIDSETGEVIGYLFDSLRCIAVGRGSRHGNEEVIEWRWKCGPTERTSIRTTERVDQDKMVVADRFLAPDGSTWMEGKLEATRKK